MSVAVQAAIALCAVTCLATGWVLWRVHAGRLTSLATVASGAVLLTELGLRSADIVVDLKAVAGLALGPVALASYPGSRPDDRGSSPGRCCCWSPAAGRSP